MGKDTGHRFVSVDIRHYCPALIGQVDLPGEDIDYEIVTDPDHQAQGLTTCPAGETSAWLELEEAYNKRETANGRIRSVVKCPGCTHLPEGFESKKLQLKPEILR